MKIILTIAGMLTLGLLLSCSGMKNTGTEPADAPQEAAKEQASEWISLFDGETLEGWKRYHAEDIGPLWSVEDGAIKCDGKGHGEGSPEYGGSDHPGDLW